jgi:phenylacetate-CoA ligase
MKNLHQYKKIEFSPARKIKDTQEKLLKEHILYCKRNSPYYRKILKGINIRKVSLNNLSSLPLTDKSDLEKNNDAFLAAGSKNIVDIVLSSGTCGRPTKIAYTEFDLQRLSYNEELSFAGCGVTSNDTVLLTCTLDRCFVAGLAYFLGVRALGATAVRNGLNSLESHLEVIRRMRPNVIVGVPSFLRKLGLYIDSNFINPRKLGVIKLVCIGEPLRDKDMKFLKVGEDLEEIWGARAYSTYSSSEIVSTFCECTAQQGGHLHPDLAIVEIVDESGKILPYGQIGEVVVTPLRVEGMPLLRFKTGDISFLIEGACSCKRKSLRLGPILGRKKQMMKVQGTTLYPQAVYSCLEEIPGVSEYYISATGDDVLSDNIQIYVAVRDPGCTQGHIQQKLQARLRVKPEVFIVDEVLVKEQVYTPHSRKPIRFIDRRKCGKLPDNNS